MAAGLLSAVSNRLCLLLLPRQGLSLTPGVLVIPFSPTPSSGVQKTWSCGTVGHGLAGMVVLG